MRKYYSPLLPPDYIPSEFDLRHWEDTETLKRGTEMFSNSKWIDVIDIKIDKNEDGATKVKRTKMKKPPCKHSWPGKRFDDVCNDCYSYINNKEITEFLCPVCVLPKIFKDSKKIDGTCYECINCGIFYTSEELEEFNKGIKYFTPDSKDKDVKVKNPTCKHSWMDKNKNDICYDCAEEIIFKELNIFICPHCREVKCFQNNGFASTPYECPGCKSSFSLRYLEEFTQEYFPGISTEDSPSDSKDKDVKMKEQKFWVVINLNEEHFNQSQNRSMSLEEAEKKATKLVQRYPHLEFLICEAKKIVRTKHPVEMVDLE